MNYAELLGLNQCTIRPSQDFQLPDTPPGSRPAFGLYWDKRRYEEMKVLPRQDELQGFVLQAKENLLGYEPWLSFIKPDEHDLMEDITCTQLGRTCSEFEQSGFISKDGGVPWSEPAIKAVIEKYKGPISRVSLNELSLDLPTDTNLCYPVLNAFKGEGNRAFLLAYYAIASAILSGRTTLMAVMFDMTQKFGEPFISLGYRVSRKGGKLLQPLLYGGRVESQGVINRTRAIYLGIKILMILTRLYTKKFTKAATTMIEHDPTKPSTTDFFNKYDNKGWVFGGFDAKKFDKNNGESRLRKALTILSVITGCPEEYLQAEIQYPCCYFNSGEWYLCDSKPLFSGIGPTTCVNILIVDLMVAEAAVRGGYTQGVDYDYKNWGDDQVYFFRTEEIKATFMKLYAEMNFLIEEEVRRQFLGDIYEPVHGNVSRKALPQILKNGLNREHLSQNKWALVIGTIARHDALLPQERRMFLKGLSDFLRINGKTKYEMLFGPVFNWSKSQQMLVYAVQQIPGAELNGVVRMMYSGMDIEELLLSNAADSFTQAIRAKYANIVSSPTGSTPLNEKELAMVSRTMSPLVQNAYKNAALTGSSDILIHLSMVFKGKYQAGNPIM